MIRILEELAEAGYGSAAILTYGADLGFFESKVLGALQESGCRNIVVIADGHQVKDALNSAAELRHVGIRYSLVPVRLGNQAFHPKAILLAGEKKLKVLIGSGNLTLPGYTRNWEIFTRLTDDEAAGTALELLGVFEDAASRSALLGAFSDWRMRLDKHSPRLLGASTEPGAVTLLTSVDGPILPRAVNLLGEREVTRLLIVSPFLDSKATALQWLVANIRPKRLRFLASEGVQLNPTTVTESLLSSTDGKALGFVGEGRPLHGKAVLFQGPWGEALLAGSPNLTSSALLRKAGARGNYELATFQLGRVGEFSALFEKKVGPEVDLAALHPRRPLARGNRVGPLELEAAWIHERTLYAVPANRGAGPNSITLRLERRGAEIFRSPLLKDTEGVYRVELRQEDTMMLDVAPSQACWVGGEDTEGSLVWVQNLDAIKRRANPVQRPRYGGGLKGLGGETLGLDEDSWNNLFEAFFTLSKGWSEYAQSFRPTRPPTGSRPTKSDEREGSTPDPDTFYVAVEDVRIKLPAYFAKIENSGWSIGDFEYLISALPTAGLNPVADQPEPDDSTTDEDDRGEGSDENGEITTDPGENGQDEQTKEERRKRLGDNLFKRFGRLVDAYAESVGRRAETEAEVTLVSSLYVAMHLAIARAATARLLDTSRFRELVARSVRSWMEEVWTSVTPELREQVEASTGCTTMSLAAVAAATSPWARKHLEDQDEYDAEMFTKLAGTLRTLRPFYLQLKADLESGEEPARWMKATDEYTKLGLGSVDSLSRFWDLERRYEVWRLDEASALQRALKQFDLHEVAAVEDSILRVRAPLPHSMHRRDLLSKLLYVIHEGVDKSAAVVWENSDLLERIRQIALVLVPEEKAVLEVTRYASGNFLFWSHSANSGSLVSGVYLGATRTLPSTLLQQRPRCVLVDRAIELVPELFDR